MLFCSQRLYRPGAFLLTLCIAGCVVEQPQPTPPPKSPPPVVAPPSVPPPAPTTTPKTYSGTYPERIEAEAHDLFAGTSVRVQRNTNTVKLTLPASAAFAANSSQLQQRFFPALDSVARLCRDYTKATLTIKGFTDSTGSFEHNQQLSEQRAQSISTYLSRDVAAGRLRTAGYGPRNPIADNNTDAGRIQNRRIEIDIVTTP